MEERISGMLPHCLMTRGRLSIRVYWAASINTTARDDFALTVVEGGIIRLELLNVKVTAKVITWISLSACDGV
jgi:hypothetical protein